jgi:hypothetical protein
LLANTISTGDIEQPQEAMTGDVGVEVRIETLALNDDDGEETEEDVVPPPPPPA